MIYAGATVLGRITIGRGSSIGGNVWLTYSVPPGSNITRRRPMSNSSTMAPASDAIETRRTKRLRRARKGTLS